MAHNYTNRPINQIRSATVQIMVKDHFCPPKEFAKRVQISPNVICESLNVISTPNQWSAISGRGKSKQV